MKINTDTYGKSVTFAILGLNIQGPRCKIWINHKKGDLELYYMVQFDAVIFQTCKLEM